MSDALDVRIANRRLRVNKKTVVDAVYRRKTRAYI